MQSCENGEHMLCAPWLHKKYSYTRIRSQGYVFALSATLPEQAWIQVPNCLLFELSKFKSLSLFYDFTNVA